MKRLINQRPSGGSGILLGLLPFFILIIAYLYFSEARLAVNSEDKLLPNFSQMFDTMHRMSTEINVRTENYIFWSDTVTSLQRLGIGMLIVAAGGLVVGLLCGALPMFSAIFSPLLTVVSLVPPLALLPILFIILGLEEASKIGLIAIGITPFIAREIQQRTLEIPVEQIIKAETLGANTGQIIIRVLLPQILPKLIDALRLSLGAGWLFLIAAEAIAADAGLGYRIFLVRRYFAMDVIIPYVVWITLLAFVFDWCLKALNKKLFPWHVHGGAR